MGLLAGTSGKSLRCDHGQVPRFLPSGSLLGKPGWSLQDNFLTGLVQSQIAGPHPQSHGVSRSGLGLRMRISSKFLGDAAAAGPETTLCEPAVEHSD